MFDTFFTQIKVRSRMEIGPIGPYLSEIAAALHRDGYTRGTIRRHLRAADLLRVNLDDYTSEGRSISHGN